MVLLHRAVRALGSRAAVADFLGVTLAELDRAEALPASWERRIDALLAVHRRLRSLPQGTVPPGWLRLPNSSLDGAAPEDVLSVEGARPVLDAIEREFGS